VKETYELRSSLVHGNKQKLDGREREIRDQGAFYLRGVLKQEVDAIEQSHKLGGHGRKL
jgi:hypothetical protein